MKPTRTKKTAPRSHPGVGLLRAEVLAVLDADHILVRPGTAPTEEVLKAEIAAIGYVPSEGDRVVLQPGEEGWFVVGALGEARRRHLEAGLYVAIRSEGGVELRAREGDLTLSAPGRVVLRATEVVTEAGRVEVDAGRLVERAGDAYRRVEGLAELQAGRARTLVEGACQLVAQRTSVTSDEDTIIDGKRVLLG